MHVWFIRCNGETAHNEPGTARYVHGEPPEFPEREFNYRDECLCKGFARVGWPAAGDLRRADWRSRALDAYGSMMKDHHAQFLDQFVRIEVGDLVLLPTYQKRCQVYLGVVVSSRRKQESLRSGGLAYDYHFDISAGDWFENAHRVDVRWAKRLAGLFQVFDVPEVGGTWIRGFGEVKAGTERIQSLTQHAPLRV
jgi:hypothetical protein